MANNVNKMVSVVTLFTTRNENIVRYLHDVNAVKPIDNAQMQDLYIRAKQGDESAVSAIVAQNLKLVISIAKRYEFASGLALEDLINEGNIGLLMAARQYDYTKGLQFSTIAAILIRQQIIEAIRSVGRAVRYPKNQENADYLCTSADAPQYTDNEGNEVSFLDNLCSDFHTDDLTQVTDTQVIVAHLLSKMHRAKDKEIITKLFGIGCREHTQRELADTYHCTEEAIRQIKFRALDEMAKLISVIGTL